MADHETVSSYDQDFYAWTQEQAALLRAAGEAAQSGGSVRQDLSALLRSLDWDNLVEEIGALGRSDRRELGSRLALIIEHLAKLEFSPAAEPRTGWMETIDRSRGDVAAILKDSPSLRREVPEMILDQGARALRRAARSLAAHGEMAEAIALRLAAGYSEPQVLDDWWPADDQGTGGPSPSV
jgi:hypothetical protein